MIIHTKGGTACQTTSSKTLVKCLMISLDSLVLRYPNCLHLLNIPEGRWEAAAKQSGWKWKKEAESESCEPGEASKGLISCGQSDL